MNYIPDEWGGVVRKNAIGPAGRAALHGTGTPVLPGIIGQRRVYQFKRTTQPVVLGEPFPPASVQRPAASQRKIPFVRILHDIDPVTAGVFQFHCVPAVAQASSPAADDISNSWIACGERGDVSGDDEITTG